MRSFVPSTDVGNAFIGFSAGRLRMMETKGTKQISFLTFAAQLAGTWVQAETFPQKTCFWA